MMEDHLRELYGLDEDDEEHHGEDELEHEGHEEKIKVAS